MKIKRVSLFLKAIPMSMGNTCSLDASIDAAEVVVTRIETDTGLVGIGECGTVAGYPASARSVIEGSADLAAAHLMDMDPTLIGAVNERLLGVPGQIGALRTGIDMACWDILGKAEGKPLHALLGGKLQETVPIYCLIVGESPDELASSLQEWRQKGFKRFHFRVVRADIATHQARINRVLSMREAGETFNIDFAGTWRAQDVLEIINGIDSRGFTLEQPGWTMAECAAIRGRVDQAVKLDDCINSPRDVLDAVRMQACESVVLHINRIGGVTPVRLARDIAAQAGLRVTYSTQWGTEITTAAMTHLAITTPPGTLLTSIDAHAYSPLPMTATSPFVVEGQEMWFAEDKPGLGVDVDEDALGELVRDIT